MKLILAFILGVLIHGEMAIGSNTYAQPNENMATKNGQMGLKKDVCYYLPAFEYIIAKRLSDTVYELVSDDRNPRWRHAILNTTESEFKRPGRMGRFFARHIDIKSVKTESGFPAEADIWEECKDPNS